MPFSSRSAQVACAIVGWGRLWSCRARSRPSSSSFSCGGVSEHCSFESVERFACFRLNVCVGAFREWGQRAWLCVPRVRGEQEVIFTAALSAGRGAWPWGQRWHKLWYGLGDSFWTFSKSEVNVCAAWREALHLPGSGYVSFACYLATVLC